MQIAETTDEPLELINGQIIKVANATPRKGKIVSNVSYLLGKNLPEQAFCFSNMVFVLDEYHCPHTDILIVENDSVNGEFLQNPTVVAQIVVNLNDKENLTIYQNCPSIFEILMIEQTKAQITVHRRGKFGRWSDQVYQNGDEILLDSINLTLKVDDIYQKVVFDQQ